MFQNTSEEKESYIIESHKRCLELGMDPSKPNIPKNSMSPLELGEEKEVYKEILQVVKLFSEKLISTLKDVPICIVISDERGYLLDTIGDRQIQSAMAELGIIPGIQFSHDDLGTNVVSLTLEQNKPIQLIGDDHFHVPLHNSACYGVPLHAPDVNRLLGSICIMTPAIFHNPFILATLTTVIDAIERELLLRKQNQEIHRQKELLYESEKKQRELLEKDLVMKDEFISLITHEFKTPISVNYSAIQLIEHVYIDKIPDRVKNLIGSIKQNTFRQLRLVNNLLDITRLHSNQFKLYLSNADIVSLTRLITESVKLYAYQKKIKVSFITDINSRITALDEEKYERTILNLLSNAIKFTPEGGSITVRINEGNESNTMYISVTDTGLGIPEEKQEKIFERFGQVESNLSRQAEGSGIGLALVKMLVEIMGGTIQLDSKLGTGSTFTITLPMKECPVQKERSDYLDTDSRLINAINVEFSDIYF